MGKEQVHLQAWPPGGLPQHGGLRLLPVPRPTHSVTALPPRCLPAFLATTVLYFPLFLPIPTCSPPKKKITGKKEEREGRSLHWGGTGGVLPTISVSRSGILQRALCARAAFCGTRSDGCEPAQGTGLT